MIATVDELLEAATELIDKGLPIIPCDGKVPMLKGWQHATVSADAVEAELASADQPSIGLVMGPRSGIIDVECDDASEVEAVKHLFRDIEPVITVAYKSQRGRHDFYKYDPRLEPIGKAVFQYKDPAGNSVKIRLGLGGGGAQSIIPPSAGREWWPGLSLDDCDPAPLPELVIQRLLAAAAKSSDGDNSTPGNPAAAVNGSIMNGQRNATLASLAGTMRRRGMGFDAIRAALQAENASSCTPPLSRAEVDTIAASISKYAPGDPRPVKRPRTDLGNGERFVAMHGDAVRYIHPWGKWLVWDGIRWRVDDSGEAMRLAKLTAKAIYREAELGKDAAEQDEIAKWAKASQSKARLEAMLDLAKSEHPIPVAPEQLDPNPWLLNCENGSVNLRTGKLRPHDRADLITKTTGVIFPEQSCESVLWGDFLNTIFAGNRELIGFVQRIMGLAAPGVVLEHILAIFHGGGGNGKGVFIETIMAALGEYAMKSAGGLLMQSRGEKHPTELADLFGKRLVAIVETGDSQSLNEPLVKEMTGGDTIRARRMREDFWQFKPSHLAVLVTNHRPVVRGTDYGLWRRVRLIPFTVTIPEERQDALLKDKLADDHLPAILRWVVQGCLEYQRRGLQAPHVVKAATNEYRAENDTVATWLGERCRVGAQLEIKASEAYGNYRVWGESANEKVLTQRQFGLRLSERGFVKEHRRDGSYYTGFGRIFAPCDACDP